MSSPAPAPDPDLLARCGRCLRWVEVHDGLPGVWGPLSRDASGSPTCPDGRTHLPDRVPPRQQRDGTQVTTYKDSDAHAHAVDAGDLAAEVARPDGDPGSGGTGSGSGGRGGSRGGSDVGPTPGTGSTGSGSEALPGSRGGSSCPDCGDCGGDCSPCLVSPGLVLLLWTGLVGLLAPRRSLSRHGEHPAGGLRGRLLAAVRLYQLRVSAVRPARCRYAPTCSAYAAQALQRHGVVRGLLLTAGRLSRCRPGTPGGPDPV